MVGRFQPFHKGHIHLAKIALKECDELIIVIGSAQFNYIATDPFTAGERILMAHSALLKCNFDLARCYIIPVVNDENNSRWLAHLQSMIPEFQVLYSGNLFVKYLVHSEIQVRSPQFLRKNFYNGANIRKLISQKKQWKHLVPPAVATIIEDIHGTKRIQILSKTQQTPSINRYPNIK